MKGGIFDFYLRKLALGVGEKDMGDFAAMTLGEGDGERVFGQFFGRTFSIISMEVCGK
jgi:hypothetical protein